MDLAQSEKLDYGVAEKALESVNGDAIFISVEKEHMFIGIVDGAGHGQGANIIANKCLNILESSKTLALPILMERLHEKLKGTYGAVAVIGKLNYASQEFSYVGIGNIFLRVFGTHSKQEITQGGVIGYSIRTPKEKIIKIDTGNILVLHTDGISSNFNATDYPDILWDDTKIIADNLIEKFGKNNDDATCIVIRLIPVINEDA
jgi:negative regulator of sigma-B (phosphoserine phosphatase)